MNNKILLIAAGIIILIGGGYLLMSLRNSPAQPVMDQQQMKAAPVTETAPSESPATKSSGTDQGIQIANFSFAPIEIRIKAGTKVVWTNDDSVPHTVTSDNGKFDSGLFDQRKKFEFTFAEKGTFPYHCAVHPSMKATVIVE